MYSLPLCTTSLVLTISAHPKNRWLAERVEEKNFFQINSYCWGWGFCLGFFSPTSSSGWFFLSIQILQNGREQETCGCWSAKTDCLRRLLLFLELLVRKKSLLGSLLNLWVNFRAVILEVPQCWSSLTANIQLRKNPILLWERWELRRAT